VRCPNDGSKLQKLGISLVCPRCSFKKIQPEKFWIPEIHIFVDFPREYAWSTWTASDLTVSGDTVSMSSGKTLGTISSPQFTNLDRADTRLLDFTKVRIESDTAENNEGRIYFYASNDGGTTWTQIKDDAHIWELNHGKEGIYGTEQTKYSDLRFRVEMKRQTSSATSPTITTLKCGYNKIPDDRRTA